MKRFSIMTVILVLFCSTFFTHSSAAEKSKSEKELASSALPIVQSYEVDEDAAVWEMDGSTRFVIPDTEAYMKNDRLKEVVEFVSAEFLEKGVPIKSEIEKVYAKEEEVSAQDIVVTLDKEQPITKESDSEEAYKIDISEEGVKIVAASENAAMYALRTIQQLMLANNHQLASGTIIDYPDLEERRVHIDMARKHITKEWIIQHIREMSYFKMNAIQLHFSENLGFRIESETDPEIVSEDGYLTKKEVKEIIAEAKKYGVKVIPSLDTPGHTEHILKVHPEYGQVDIDGNHSDVALDVTNPEAVEYIKSLYTEYMELFEESTDFHIGADEYMEFDRPPFTTKYKQVLDDYAHETLGDEYTWKDVMADYINEIAAHVHQGDFKPRIWNDGIYYGENNADEPKQQIKMHDYIGVDFWSQMAWNPDIADLNTFVQKGHEDIYNLNASFFYYVLRNDKPDDGREQHSFDYLNQDKRIYEEWTPGKFQENTVDDDATFIKGTSLAIWNDNPDLVGEDVITKDIAKELRALASKSWNTASDKIADFKQFTDNYQQLGNVAAFKKGSALPEVQEVKQIETIDTKALEQLMTDADEKSADDYTTDSWDALTKALKKAEKLLKKEDVTQKEIDEAAGVLQTALDGLIKDKDDPSEDQEGGPLVPMPQNVHYYNGSLQMSDQVNVIGEEFADKNALKLLMDFLEANDVEVLEKFDKKATTIIIGDVEDIEAELKDVDSKLILPKELNLAEEGYMLSVHSRQNELTKGGTIVIAGKDGAGTFYGVKTWMQLAQHKKDDVVFKNAMIIDEPDMHVRGIVEGFYGDPWSHEERLDQIEFYGDYKMNTYIYAPKDDPYHREKWRDPYPEDEMERMEELIGTAKDNKVDFVFAISPGIDIRFDGEKGEEDFKALLAKSESLYDMGVRNFAILFDDIDNRDGKKQAQLLNRFNKEFVQEKEDVNPLITVPTLYDTHAMGAPDHVNQYTKDFAGTLDKDVKVMWTGQVVVAESLPLENVEIMKDIYGDRAALWWNYPVSDYLTSKLALGPIVDIDKGIKDEIDFFTMNPMEHANLSKITLSTGADFSWNIADYDADTSWNHAIDLLFDELAPEMKTFANHSSRMSGSWDVGRKDAEEVRATMDDFWMNVSTRKNADKEIKQLTEEFNQMVQAAKTLKQELPSAMLEESSPNLDKLGALGENGKRALKMIVAQTEGEEEKSKALKKELEEALPDLEQGARVSEETALAFIQEAMEFSPLPQPSFEVSKTLVAPGEEVQLKNTSSLPTEELEWVFAGAKQEKSTEENPTIVYEEEGVYTIKLVGKNALGKEEVIKEDIITVTNLAKEDTINLALNQDATASSACAPTEGPENAVDGSLHSKWCGNGKEPHTLTIDLGSIHLVSEIKMKHAEEGGEPAGGNTAAYRLEISEDGETYTELAKVTNNKKGTTIDQVPATKGRYVRLIIDQPTQGDDTAARIYEFEANGIKGDVTLPPKYEGK